MDAYLTLDGPTDILVIPGLTMPTVEPDYLVDIEAAAPAGSRVRAAPGMKQAAEMAADTEIVLGFIDRRLYDAAPNLRRVHAIASGMDTLLFPDLVASEVIITGEKGLVGGHLADTGFGLLLALTRQIHTAVRLGPDAWAHRVDMRMKEIELEGLTMGLLGFGGTGRAMAQRAVAFGMHTIAVDEYPSPGAHGVEEVWPTARLPELLESSDVVAICCPLTPETDRLFDEARFAAMRPGSYLVNVTRGEIVDGDALVAALRSGHLAGAALDVAPGEPLPADHPLFRLDNVAMTPHTAGASQHRAPRSVARFCRNLERARKGEPLEGVVDKDAGY
ncbi:MAG: D-2-hydroxyacid dehydrogenase [Acidimicrobiales bacterium]